MKLLIENAANLYYNNRSLKRAFGKFAENRLQV